MEPKIPKSRRKDAAYTSSAHNYTRANSTILYGTGLPQPLNRIQWAVNLLFLLFFVINIFSFRVLKRQRYGPRLVPRVFGWLLVAVMGILHGSTAQYRQRIIVFDSCFEQYNEILVLLTASQSVSGKDTASANAINWTLPLSRGALAWL